MEVGPFYQSMKRYWRRRRYQRLDAAGKKNIRVVRLGGNTRRAWRIRPAFPKLRLRLRSLSPWRLLTRIRDAYVDVMLGMTGKTMGLQSSGTGGLAAKRIPQRRPAPMQKGRDFENRLLFEICKSIAASRELAAI